MKRLILATILILIGAETFANDTALINQVKKAVRSQLKDPSSAKFDYVYVVTTLSGVKSVCGEVNAKNSYGGYTGFSPFYSYRGYTKIIDTDTHNEGLLQLYSDNYAEAGCLGRDAEKRIYDRKKDQETRMKAAEAARQKEEAEKEALAAQKEAEELAIVEQKKEDALKTQIPIDACQLTYDYYVDRVANNLEHSLAVGSIQVFYKQHEKYMKESFEDFEKVLQATTEQIRSDKTASKRLMNQNEKIKNKFLTSCISNYRF